MNPPSRASRVDDAPEEPLLESAPLAWREAPLRCYRHPVTGETCRSYHQVWQYLRLLGFISTVSINTEFFLRSLGALASTGQHRRVLVSATADYGMLAHVTHAYALHRQPLEVTVADRCGTSLFLNRWYGDRYRAALETHEGDVLQFASEQPFDVICTHSFLGRFEPDDRARLATRWRDLLRPGGVVVTTQRIRPGSASTRNTYASGQADRLSAAVKAAARAYPGDLGVHPDDLAGAVREYARHKGGFTIAAAADVTSLFAGAGLEVVTADPGEDEERARDRPSSPVDSQAFRLRIIARRP